MDMVTGIEILLSGIALLTPIYAFMYNMSKDMSQIKEHSAVLRNTIELCPHCPHVKHTTQEA